MDNCKTHLISAIIQAPSEKSRLNITFCQEKEAMTGSPFSHTPNSPYVKCPDVSIADVSVPAIKVVSDFERSSS